MGRALVLKNVNFSENKLDTVQIGDSIPCTGITLSQNSISFTKLGSVTLTATLTPANTTDTLVWSTSDSSVATVSNGIVNALGLGTATITATCGSQTATCTVSVSVSLSPTDLIWDRSIQFNVNKNDFLNNNKDYQKLRTETNDKLWTISYPTSIDSAYNAYSGDEELQQGKYPIRIPNNATTVTIGIAGSAISGITMCYLNSKAHPTYSITGSKGARIVDFPSSNWASHPTITLPTGVEGLDSFVAVVTFKDDRTEMPSEFEVTFA